MSEHGTARALVMGWFSFDSGNATAGDLLASEVVCGWLREAGTEFDVVTAGHFRSGLTWKNVHPARYSDLLFVCGPIGDWPEFSDILNKFRHCRIVGVNLSFLQPLEKWNPFHFLLERDSSAAARPDVTFLSERPKVPVVGTVLVHPQNEYGSRAQHAAVGEAIARLTAGRRIAVVDIDTRLHPGNPLRTPEEIESLIARMDAVVTTRLHGTVFSLKNGVPPVVIDPIMRGAKVARHAQTVGWPIYFTPETLTNERLGEALDYCLTEEAREAARKAGRRASESLYPARDEFVRRFSDWKSGQNVLMSKRR